MKVLVVCARRYNGHELWTALGVMQERGHDFEVVSQDTTIFDEITFQPNKIERKVYDVSLDDFEANFEAIMIVSGNMDDTEAYWDDQHVLGLIERANELDRPIAAICCSVPTIRHAAKGKEVSFFPLVRSRARLEEAGAICRTVAVTVDGKLATAEHQMATQMWANAFCDIMEGKPSSVNLKDSGYTPQGRERKPMPELERIRKIVKNTGRTRIEPTD